MAIDVDAITERCEPLIMAPAEFKRSSSTAEGNLFPDLNVKLVKELGEVKLCKRTFFTP